MSVQISVWHEAWAKGRDGRPPAGRAGWNEVLVPLGQFLAQVGAAVTIISRPVLVAGFAAQDKLVRGLSLGAVT